MQSYEFIHENVWGEGKYFSTFFKKFSGRDEKTADAGSVCGLWLVMSSFFEIELLRNFGLEGGSGFEEGDVVGGNNDGGILRDVASGFFSAELEGECAEATEINVFAVGERVLNDFHKLFYDVEDGGLVDSG